MLRLSDIEPDPAQPRREFDAEALESLADSIRQHGIIQPLLVRPLSDGSYMIVAGERRWRAAKLAKLTEVPAQVKALTESEAAELTLIENLQREDLNAIEEADGIKKLIGEYGLTQEQAAQTLGRSRSAVTNSLRLLTLPDEVVKMVRDGRLSAGHARALLGLPDEKSIIHLASQVIEKQLSVRETEKAVRAMVRPARRPKEPARRDVYLSEAELSLASCLGRGVKLKEGKKGSGFIEIPYFDADDLRKLMSMIDKNK